MKINDVLLKENEESDELVAEFLGYLDHHNYWEAFNSLIGAYDTNADCLQIWHSDVQAVKSEVIKGLLHVIKHEPDLPVDAIIADMYADLKWPELLTIQKAMQHNKQQPVAEAYDRDADPMIGYIQDMYSDLKSGFAGMTVLQLRDYIYDTGSAENLANSIKQIEPELPALINQHKTDIVKNMLEIIKKDFDYAGKAVLPVLEVLHHLGIHWPESDRIAAALTQGYKSESVTEDDDDNNMAREQLQRMAANHIISAIQNKRWMSLLDTLQTIEQQQWSLDSRYRFPEKLAQYKTDIVKTILQAVKDPRWFNPDLLVAVKGLKRTGVNWPELDTIISGLQHGKVSEDWSKKYKRSIDCSHPKGFSQKAHCAGRRKHKANEDLTVTDNPRLRAWIRNIDVSLTKNMRNLFSIVIGLSHDLKTADAVSRSQVIKVLDDKKTEILKYILYHIKHLDEINIKYYVDTMIEIGITWPELKTIQQALAHGNKTESVTENDYRFSNDHKVMSGLVADEINSWLESLSRHIKAGSKIPIDSFRDVIYAIRNFNYYRLNMLQPVLEQHKKTIIYMILYILKYHSNNLKESEHILSALKYAKINWPELKSIQQALAHGNKTESVTEADDTAGFKILSDILMRDYADNKVRGFWYMLYHLNDWDMTVDQFPEFDNIIAEIKPEIIKSLLSAVKADSDGEAISNVLHSIDRMHKCGVNWPELNQIKSGLEHNRETEPLDENKYKQAEAEQYASLISSKLEQASKLQGNANYDSHMMYFLEAMLKVGQIGPGYGQILTPILEHYKPVIIRRLLLLLKQNRLPAVVYILEILFNIHIQWSELETIKKALTHGKKQTTEAKDYSKDPFDKWTKRFANDLENKLYWHFAMVLEELAKHMNVGTMRVSDSQWLQAAVQLDLNAHKREIVHSILKNLKDNIQMNSSSNWLLNSMIAQKLILNKLGADWPELDTIVSGISNNQVNN